MRLRRDADGVVVVYDITDKRTYDSVRPPSHTRQLLANRSFEKQFQVVFKVEIVFIYPFRFVLSLNRRLS